MAGEKAAPTKISHMRQVFDQGVLTPEIIDYPYEGSGTEDDPYVVQWIPDDPRNPMLYSPLKKWSITMLVAIATLAVALISSAYSGGANQIMQEFLVDTEIVTLGVSLFVLGFAVGPLIWAPMSELFGRQYVFIGTYCALTAFNGAAVASQNIETLLILRFFAGAFGSSPLTNAGGVIADMFPASQRGLAMGLFAMAPFLGPVIGPIAGGFLGMTSGWRWVEGLLAIFSGILWILGSLLLPETYPSVLLHKRANKLSKLSGKVYKSKMELDQGRVTPGDAFKTALMRPWILLFREPIVLLLSIYMAIVYGTLYMLFSAFPIVYQQHRGWNQGVGGLAFLGVLVGMIGAMVVNIVDNKRYARISKKFGGFAPPEARLPICMIGGIAIPIGLFWFAWTNGSSIHWIVSIIASAPFGFGMVLIFLSLMNYLIDSYTIYAASVLAANSVLRSLFGFAFPLFTRYMYEDLGIHWASSIPAFLALACVPFPFLFYKYGPQIRQRCKFAAEADAFMRKYAEAMQQQQQQKSRPGDADAEEPESADAEEKRRQAEVAEGETETEPDLEAGRAESIARLHSVESQRSVPERHHSIARTHSVTSTTLSRAPTVEYDGNPYDVDRVNTRLSMVSSKKASKTPEPR